MELINVILFVKTCLSYNSMKNQLDNYRIYDSTRSVRETRTLFQKNRERSVKRPKRPVLCKHGTITVSVHC